MSNREIVVYDVSAKHDADFVHSTLQQINLSKSAILHTDRGTEFVNKKVKYSKLMHRFINTTILAQ